MKKISLLAVVLCCSLAGQAQIPVLVQDINKTPVAADADPAQFIEYKGAMYFFANDGVHDHELWKYDETGSATMVADLNATGRTQPPHGTEPMVVYKSKLYFSAQKAGVHTLFVYDGVNPPAEAPGFSGFAPVGPIHELTVAGSNLYFGVQKALGLDGHTLYVYSGSAAPVRINLPAPGRLPGPQPQDLIEFRGQLYFTAYEPVKDDWRMYRLDPATNSFSLVTSSSFPDGFEGAHYKYVSGEGMYFSAHADTAGNEVFLYNGTAAVRLTNIWPNNTHSSIGPFTMYAGALYYRAGTSSAFELYKCNPTGGGSPGIPVMPGGPRQVTDPIVYKGKLYFTGFTGASGWELWRHDAGGTAMVADLFPGAASGRGRWQQSFIFNNHLYLNATDGKHGYELFRLNDPTEVQPIAARSGARVYPNPGSGAVRMELYLEAAGSCAVTVVDAAGRQVFASGLRAFPGGTSSIDIPLQSLAAGQYFYRLSGRDGELLASGGIVRQ